MKELSRQETAESWDKRWKAGDRSWDHGRPAPPFGEFVAKHGPPLGNILIPGCGSGHDVRFFAGPGANVTGLDVSETALQVARKKNPHEHAQYVAGNFLEPDPSFTAAFDWVIEHTCLCSMNPDLWPEYAGAVRRVLKTGGHFLAIFYRNPKDIDGPPFGIGESTIGDLFDAGFELLDSWVPKQSYASRTGREAIRWYRFRGLGSGLRRDTDPV